MQNWEALSFLITWSGFRRRAVAHNFMTTTRMKFWSHLNRPLHLCGCCLLILTLQGQGSKKKRKMASSYTPQKWKGKHKFPSLFHKRSVVSSTLLIFFSFFKVWVHFTPESFPSLSDSCVVGLGGLQLAFGCLISCKTLSFLPALHKPRFS